MRTHSTIPLHSRFSMSKQDINAALGIIGIYSLGVFLTWYPSAVLKIPMPENIVLQSATNIVWQTVCTIVMPYIWVMYRLGFTLADLGLSRVNLGRTTLLGCLLYSLGLAAFIYCSDSYMVANHALGTLPLPEAMGILAVMAIGVAGTDLATRGFILLSMARYTHVSIAIIAQNLVWYLGHIHEIKLLTGCLGYSGALGLTLTLGIVGDVIALRTRNVLGLAFAHVILNVGMAIYIRLLM